MLLDKEKECEKKCEMRRRAVLEAIRFCGGVVAFSKRLNVNRSRASNWCNQSDINIPYEYVVLTEDVTQVSIERLSPFTEAANQVIRRLRGVSKFSPIYIPFNEIFIGAFSFYRCFDPNRPIIVGTDRVLISGLAQMESYRNMGAKKVQVTVLDLEALMLEIRFIRDINSHLLISERVAIGIRLECLNKGSDKIYRIMDFYSEETYKLSKQIFFHGVPELISLVDKEQISINLAAAISQATALEQYKSLKKT